MNKICLSILSLILVFSGGCRNRPDKTRQEQVPLNNALTQDELIRMNRELVNREVIRIETYAKNHQWNYQLLENGMIIEFILYEPGVLVDDGARVGLDYQISDLNENELYSAKRAGKLLSFTVSQEEIEAGLNELVKKMSIGDSVRMILPPHLAFGMAGDGDRVKPHTSLIYHLKLVQVSQ